MAEAAGSIRTLQGPARRPERERGKGDPMGECSSEVSWCGLKIMLETGQKLGRTVYKPSYL